MQIWAMLVALTPFSMNRVMAALVMRSVCSSMPGRFFLRPSVIGDVLFGIFCFGVWENSVDWLSVLNVGENGRRGKASPTFRFKVSTIKYSF